MRARSLFPASALIAVATALSPTPAHAGPPWISVELPANPLDRTTRGAFLLVHTFHHETQVRDALSGRAEGLVNGKRQTITLTFTDTSRDGVRALRKAWPDGGTWVLVLSTGGHGDATVLVGIGADGKVRSIDVPTVTREGHTIPAPVSAADVDALLAKLAAADAPTGPTALHLALGSLLLLPIGLVAFRRAA